MEIETTTEAYESLENVTNCCKNPNHVGFYSLSDLSVDILPEDLRNEEWLSYFRAVSKRVVRLTVKKADGTFLYGSGNVVKDCTPKSDTLYIETNEHVVKSNTDVKNCKIEFFYNTMDMMGVETSYGQSLVSCSAKRDVCRFTFYPVPQEIKHLMSLPTVRPIAIESRPTDLNETIVISHPHGGPKKITIGKVLTYDIDIDTDGVSNCFHTARTCPGSSGGLVIYKWPYRRFEWKIDFYYYIHCGGKRRDVYNGECVETGNINQSVLCYW